MNAQSAEALRRLKRLAEQELSLERTTRVMVHSLLLDQLGEHDRQAAARSAA